MVHTRSAAPCSPAEERILRGRNFADAAATSAFITPGGAYRCAGAVAEQDPVRWTWLSTRAITQAQAATALTVLLTRLPGPLTLVGISHPTDAE